MENLSIATFASFTEARESSESTFIVWEDLGSDIIRLNYFVTDAGFPECADVVEASKDEALEILIGRNLAIK